MIDESKEKTVLKSGEENPWIQFMNKTINLDVNNGKEFGWHWFWGIYFLHKELPEFKSIQIVGVRDRLPDGHWIKKIDDYSRITPPDPMFNEIYNTLLKRDVFSSLVNSLKAINGSEKIDIIDLSGLNFDEQVGFPKLAFPVKVSFKHTVFSSRVHFNEAVFFYGANFNNTIFHKSVSFWKTILSGQLRFTNAIFFEKTNFNEAVFFSNISFTNITFSDAITFNNTKFLANANFKDVKFLKDVSFTNTEFSKITHFQTTKFYGKMTKFENTTFKGRANFYNAQFKENSQINKVKFLSEAFFYKTQFFKDINFNDTVFDELVNFREAEFHGFALFYRTKLASADFSGAQFEIRAPHFYDAKLGADIKWEQNTNHWPDTEKYRDGEDYKIYQDRIEDNQKAYENLVSHMKESNRYYDEHFFFRQEMSCRRLFEHWLANTIHWLYETLSDYGYGIGRAVSYWFLHIFLGAILIGAFSKTPRAKACDLDGNFYLDIAVSFANAHSFLFFNKGALSSCYENFTENSFLNVIWGFQTTLGIVFLFLLLLTLRTRFRLR